MRALVLSGGANKGAYQLGVLQRWMGEEGRDYEIVTGISVGALNAGGLAMTPIGRPREAIEWLVDFWRSHVNSKSIVKRYCPLGVVHGAWEQSVMDSTPLWRLIDETFDPERMKASGRIVNVGAVSLTTGQLRFASLDDADFGKWMLASSAYPVAFRPVELDDELWTDGGVMNVTPLGQAIKLGATDIDVIMTSDPFNVERQDMSGAKTLGCALRTLDLMSTRIAQCDIKITGLKNDLARLGRPYKFVNVNVVCPATSLSDDPFDFEPESVERMMERGRQDACNVITLR